MREVVSRYQSPSVSSDERSLLNRNPGQPNAKRRNLNPDLLQELENLEKDANSRKTALNTLKSYVKDLDSKSIPVFLAQVSETKEPGASFGEHTISLYEVLARVHGPNIVPQIDSIMTSIVRTLHSSAGSLPLHQACSKVAPAIARYAIDPSTAGDESAKIIRSLCKPLSDVLMAPSESVASGAALCLKILVESDNWRFASDEIVSEVCLKVSGAMEETTTQTNSHMGLAMALAKHNVFILEAYARSLLRSGLRILNKGSAEINSQRRFSAIQMINFLMKCVDSRSIASELGSVMEAMERCNDDPLLFIRGAAFEALETAKQVVAQESTRNEKGCGRGSETPFSGRAFGYASPESRSVNSFLISEGFPRSPISSVGESTCNGVERARRSGRRLWTDDNSDVDVSLKDGLFSGAFSAADSPRKVQRPTEGEDEQSKAFSGFMQESRGRDDDDDDDMIHPPRPRSPISMKSADLYITPRRLIRSLQDPGEHDFEFPLQQPGSEPDCQSDEANWSAVKAHADAVYSSSNFHGVDAVRRAHENVGMAGHDYDSGDEEHLMEQSESVSSCGETPASIVAGNSSEEAVHGENENENENEGFKGVPTRGRTFCRLAFTLISGLLLIMATVALLVTHINWDESNMVPT